MKIFFYIIIACFVFYSCGKKVDEGFGNLSATFNATNNKKFFVANVTLSNENYSGNTQYFLNIVATEEKNVDNEILISIVSNSPITAKTYIADSSKQELSFSYDTPSDNYGEVNLNLVNPLSFTITSINSNRITGNFNGKIYLDNDINLNNISITNGIFTLKY